MRFTLTYTPKAIAELATLWLAAKEPNAVAFSADSIELELRDDPHLKGELVEGTLRKFVRSPLVFYYVVLPDDCKAEVWSVRWKWS